MTTDIDTYFLEGCGRCPLGGTSACKVHDWREELQHLRMIVLDSGFTEEVKWGVPCYTHEGKNVVMVSAFKDYCTVSFLKGALLADPAGLLEAPGPNTRAARVLRYTSVRQIIDTEPALRALLHSAIDVEKAGLKFDFQRDAALDLPPEFAQKLEEDPVLKAAFEALTPGRQRGYAIHFSGAKQSQTRVSRIEKCIPKIMEGKGFHDR